MARMNTDPAIQYLRHVLADHGPPNRTDGELLREFLVDNNQHAFACLMKRHGPMVWGICKRALTHEQDAEDALQATFLVLARQAAKIRKQESLASWLHGVALHMSNDARKAAARRSKHENKASVAAPTPSPHAELSWREARAILDEEIGRLPHVYRESLLLCCLENKSCAEVAETLRIKSGTVWSRVARAKQILQKRLMVRGVELAVVLSAAAIAAESTSAAVSFGLIGTTSRVAVEMITGSGSASVSISPRVMALVQGMIKGMVLAQVKALSLVVLVLGCAVVCLGAGAARWMPESTRLADAPETQITSGLARLSRGQGGPDLPAPTDFFGDPLPAGAVARLGTIRFRQGDTLAAIAFSPDGKAVAASGLGAVVHIWETASGKEISQFTSRSENELNFESIGDLVYSPDGTALAGAPLNKPVCIWDAASGKELYRLKNVQADWLVLSRDSQLLACNGRESKHPIVHVVNLKMREEVHAWGGLQGAICRPAFSPDGETLACADEKGIHFLAIRTGQVRDLPGAGKNIPDVKALAFTPDGKTLIAVRNAEKSISLIEMATGKSLLLMPLPCGIQEEHQSWHQPSISLTPDGTRLITGHVDGFIRIWDLATGKLAREFRAHAEKVLALALSPDGRTLATSSHSSNGGDIILRLWETATGKPVSRLAMPEDCLQGIAFSPDNKHVATHAGGSVQLWETVSGKLTNQFRSLYHEAFLPNGQTLVASGGGKVHFIDIKSGKEVRQFQAHPKYTYSLVLSADGKTLATAGSHGGSDNFIRLWDTASGKQLHDFGGKQKGFFFGLAFTPDARLLASIHQKPDAVKLWDTSTGKLVREDRAEASIGCVAFSPDGKLSATTISTRVDRRHEGQILLREVSTGKIVRTIRGVGDSMDSVVFSPDGHTLAWGGQTSKDLILIEVATGQVRRKLSGHQGIMSRVAFSPNGRWIGSASYDATALIWDARADRHVD
jgi:RNA polymerase sigma factor (sigma-70 family)